MSRLPNYRKNSLQGMQDYLRAIKQQQNRSQFSPRILASDGSGGMTRDRAIGNDALASPVAYHSGFANNDGPFDITMAEQEFAAFDIAIPDGYSKALVVANSSTGLINPLPDNSSVASRIYLDVTGPGQSYSARRYQGALAGFDVSVTSSLSWDYTGLAGGTIRASLVLLATANWPNTAGGASVIAFAIFTR